MKKIFLLLLAASFLLLGCAKNNSDPQDELPGVDVPSKRLNIEMQLYDDVQMKNTFQNGQELILRLKNLTDKRIVMDPAFGVKIFVKQENSWKEVQNQLGYPNSDLYLPTLTANPGGQFVGSIPFVPDMKKPMTIRIFVRGHFEDDKTSAVGATLDLLLKP